MNVIPENERTRWEVWDGTCHLTSGRTEAEALRSAKFWTDRWAERPVAILSTRMPDGGGRVNFPWAGGTWGGQCGSSIWIDDPEGHISYLQDGWPGHERSTQAQHANWVDGSEWFLERKPDRVWAWGVRVVCLEPTRHEGSCHEGPWRWTWRDDLRYRSNLHKQTGQHTLLELLPV